MRQGVATPGSQPSFPSARSASARTLAEVPDYLESLWQEEDSRLASRASTPGEWPLQLADSARELAGTEAKHGLRRRQPGKIVLLPQLLPDCPIRRREQTAPPHFVSQRSPWPDTPTPNQANIG